MTHDELLQLIDQAQLESWEELDLKDKGLMELPSEIGTLMRLRKLDLSSSPSWENPEAPNQLAELPAEIGQLSNLSNLILSSNQLSELPHEIGQLNNIVILQLNGNPCNSI